jgi:hypothetical protein
MMRKNTGQGRRAGLFELDVKSLVAVMDDVLQLTLANDRVLTVDKTERSLVGVGHFLR